MVSLLAIILVPEDKFQETFGEKWSDVLKEGRGVNAMEACKLLISFINTGFSFA